MKQAYNTVVTVEIDCVEYTIKYTYNPPEATMPGWFPDNERVFVNGEPYHDELSADDWQLIFEAMERKHNAI